jgi:monoamine oxidase
MAIAIIGAGMAGLAAARELHAAGVAVEIFEATDRIGGRAHDLAPHGVVPLQLGPEFVHGRPESTLDLLRAARLPMIEITDTHHQPRHGQLARIDDIWERFGDLLKPAARQRHDESARSYLERQHMSADDRRMFAMLVEGFYAAPLDDISIKSIADDASGAAGEEATQARVRGGYGSLVAWLAEELHGVQIRHGHVVRVIDWTGPVVRIDGDFIAEQAIVTVPVGVLRDIAFTPGLGDHEAALDKLAMGPVVKLLVCFREPVWPRELEFVHGGEAGFPTYWLRSAFDSHVLTAWAGGPHARALAGCAAEQLVDRVLDGFARLVGTPAAQLRDAVRDHHHHDWLADPFARGAYSYTRVGGGEAAQQLARPLGDRIWLAGEATDAAYEGTVAGAIASGQRAARQILALRGRRVAA